MGVASVDARGGAWHLQGELHVRLSVCLYVCAAGRKKKKKLQKKSCLKEWHLPLNG